MSLMITNISFSNYKAFESGTLELKPITVLLGANSSGKSSLLQLILLLAQSIQSTDEFLGAFKLNGRYVSLGESHNILRDKNRDNEFRVRLDCQCVEIGLAELHERAFGDIYSFFRLSSITDPAGDISPELLKDFVSPSTLDFVH